MQLEMFVAVVDEGGVSKAAARVLRTQPAVTMALRKLEDEVGTPLFVRSTPRDLRPTPAGRTLYHYATEVLRLRHEALCAMADCRAHARMIGRPRPLCLPEPGTR